jgi:hypothetical protein
MAMLKHMVLTVTAALVFMFVSQCEAATKGEIARINWNKQSIAELERLLPDLKAVQQFAGDLLVAEPDVDLEDLAINPPEVVDYELADLKGDGSVQLVCLLDYTGHKRPTQLMAIENNQGNFETAYLEGGEGGLGIGLIQEVLRDLKHDGRKEVLMSYALEPFQGAVVPTPHLEHVYVYQDGQFVQSDRGFITYYENEVLPKLRQTLKGLAQQTPPEDSLERELYQMSLDAKRKEIAAVSKMLLHL